LAGSNRVLNARQMVRQVLECGCPLPLSFGSAQFCSLTLDSLGLP
jgi:hypothetical protein